MIKNKYISVISIILLFISLIGVYSLTYYLKSIDYLEPSIEYASRLFNDNYVHKINIDIDEDNWNLIVDIPEKKEYYPCNITIDDVVFNNVGIRTKGFSSLQEVKLMGDSERYSLKIDFNRYDSVSTYFGLDKIALNNLCFDASYLRDYFALDMMNFMGVKTPLISFTEVYINGEYLGLYTALECVENSFLHRNYGKSKGELYKPFSENPIVIDYLAEIVDFYEDLDINEGAKRDIISFIEEHYLTTGFSHSDIIDIFREYGYSESFSNTVLNNMLLRVQSLEESQKVDYLGSDLVYKGDSVDLYPEIFDNVKIPISYKDKQKCVRYLKNLNKYINVDNLTSYFAVDYFVANSDGYICQTIHNYYLYLNDKLNFIPWDYNAAFKQEDLSSSIVGTYHFNYDIKQRPVFYLISQNYLDEYIEKLEYLMEKYFKSGYFEMKLNKQVELIRPYVEKDITSFYGIEDFDKAVKDLEFFCKERIKNVELEIESLSK